MNIPGMRALKRLAVGLVIAGSLGGCAVCGPPYAAAYDPYYYPSYGYGYPTYVGPPVALNFGFGYYDRGGYGHRHGYGKYHGGRSHGWHGRGGGWSHRGGGWGYGRGRR